jgi:hypothetical protein
MLERKHKRKFLSKIPYIFFGLLLVTIFLIFVSVVSYILSSKVRVLSPIATSSTYKNGSLEGELQKNNIQFSKIEVATDSSYLIFLKDDGLVQMSKDKSFSDQITSLQLISSRLTIEGRKFKRLDLRFNEPIIVF